MPFRGRVHRDRTPHEHSQYFPGSQCLIKWLIFILLPGGSLCRSKARGLSWGLLRLMNNGGSELIWNQSHTQFSRLVAKVLEFGLLIFGFVMLHALALSFHSTSSRETAQARPAATFGVTLTPHRPKES